MFFLLFIERFLTEVDKRLSCFGNIAVFFPCKTDIDEDWFFQRQRFNMRCVLHDKVKQKCHAHIAGDKTFNRFYLIGFKHDIRFDIIVF